MPMGHRVFLELPGASRLRPCTRTHLKKGLVPHSSGWWDGRQILFLSLNWVVTFLREESFFLLSTFKRRTKQEEEKEEEKRRIGVPIFILRPTSVRMWHKAVLRWVLSQGRSPTRQAVPKMPRTPSAFPFSGRLRRRAIKDRRIAEPVSAGLDFLTPLNKYFLFNANMPLWVGLRIRSLYQPVER